MQQALYVSGQSDMKPIQHLQLEGLAEVGAGAAFWHRASYIERGYFEGHISYTEATTFCYVVG
jgi:hypothetical protein